VQWTTVPTPPADAGADATSSDGWFTGLWGAAANDVWLGKSDGTILHWSGGPSWSTVIASAADARIRDISGSSANNVWAIGENLCVGRLCGRALHWDGAAWSAGTPFIDGGGAPYAVPINVQTVAVLGVNDVWYSAGLGAGDGLEEWTIYHWDGQTLSAPPHAGTLVGPLEALSPSEMWGVGRSPGPGLTSFLHWRSGTWSEDVVPISDVQAHVRGFAGGAANAAWAVGMMGKMMRYDGNVWSELSAPLGGGNFNAIGGSSATDIWAAATLPGWRDGDDIPWHMAHFDGQSWSLIPTDLRARVDGGSSQYVSLSGVWSLSPNRAFAVGGGWSPSSPRNGVILRWDGTAWTTISKGLANDFLDIWGASENDVWTVGHEPCADAGANNCGTIFHFDGSQWSRAYLDASPSRMSGIWGTSPSNVWAVSSTSGPPAWGPPKVLQWDGSSWQVRFQGPDKTFFYDVHGSAADDFWVVGGTNFGSCGSVCSALFHYNGSTFEDHSPGKSWWLYSVRALSPRDAWAVGPNGDFLHWDGQSWAHGTVQETDIRAIWGTSSSDLWTAGQGVLRLR
jgi:hypothetical protein